MDKIEIPKSEKPHYRSDFGTWVQCGDGIDLTKKETRDNVPGSNLKEKVGACIIGVLTQFDFEGLKEKQKIAIPVQFDCNKTREEMRRIATKNWKAIHGLGEALPRGFDFLELIRDKNECVLWFVFQRRG